MNNQWEKGKGGIQGSTKQPTLEEQKVLLWLFNINDLSAYVLKVLPTQILGGGGGSIPFIPSESVLLCSNKLTHRKPIVCHFINVYNM